MGQLAENGRGTDLSLSNAYFMYLRNAFHGGDGTSAPSRASPKTSRRGLPYPPELIETMEDFPDELRALAGDDDGPLDVEEAFAFDARHHGTLARAESDGDSDSERGQRRSWDERLLAPPNNSLQGLTNHDTGNIQDFEESPQSARTWTSGT